LECDPVSSYGGVIASNREVDGDLAKDLTEIFLEVILAPRFSDDALAALQKRENLRILEVGRNHHLPTGAFISGGILIQERDEILSESSDDWDLVAGEAVSEAVMADLRFAWRSVRSVKSNAIVIAKDQATIGIGMGQVSRVDAARLAVIRGGDRVKGAVAASDAFFPFADGAMELANAGVVAIVQPGGSKRDNEVIEAMSMAGISMYLTHRRHFSH
jgi:phosphoribosylaminoimidazolecarboxamide formyltransferase/IMP cyclohydrolase